MMNFPEITTKQVFDRIPQNGLEANAEFAWNAALWMQGNCEIERKKVGNGFPDGIVRFYSEDKKNYVWMLVEYKKNSSLFNNSIVQLLMYLGNIFYDTSLEGTDNFVGIISASSDHFILIPRPYVCKMIEEFEPIWRKNFRVRPCDAYKEYDIKQFFNEHEKELMKNSLICTRRTENIRLNEIIKSIYEEWNLM